MPFTDTGKTKAMSMMVHKNKLAFGTIDDNGVWTELDNTDGAGNETYTRMSIYHYSNLASYTNTSSTEYKMYNNPENYDNVLFVEILNGVVVNLYDAYFNDADDGVTPDSLDALDEGGWKDTINAIAIYKGDTDTWYYASKFTDTPIHVYNGHRIKLPKGQFQITFNPIENGETASQASTQSEAVALNMESEVTLEVEE